MGYVRHHAIVVTSWNLAKIAEAHRKAVEIFGDLVTPIVDGRVNVIRSFLVGPDGSKEGWAESDEGDVQRTAFVDWLNAERYDDGSSCLDWVLVQYGDDNLETCVVDDSDAARRATNDAEAGLT